MSRLSVSVFGFALGCLFSFSTVWANPASPNNAAISGSNSSIESPRLDPSNGLGSSAPRMGPLARAENPSLPSPGINFTGGSLFIGSGLFSIWVRGALNEAGTMYVAVYTTNPGAMSAAQIRTAAITAGVQNSPVNGAVEVPGTPVGSAISQVQVFTAASTPATPAFAGTPYAGARFTGLAFNTTYFI